MSSAYARTKKTGDGAAGAAPSASSVSEQIPKARDAALRLLATRERSRAELRQRLRTKGFHLDAIEAALDRLAETGLQSDDRFAERYAAEMAARGKASRLIRTELRGKGIDIELSASAATVDPNEEVERARGLARARAARMRGIPPEARARRIAGWLARRGYDGETCRTIAAEIADPDGPSGIERP